MKNFVELVHDDTGREVKLNQQAEKLFTELPSLLTLFIISGSQYHYLQDILCAVAGIRWNKQGTVLFMAMDNSIGISMNTHLGEREFRVYRK